MSRVLLDENVPVGLRCLTAEFLGWKAMANGRLLDAAEAARFDVLVTADQNIRFQQSLVGRTVAMIVPSSTNWDDIRGASEAIGVAVDRATAGAVLSVQVPGSRERREDL